MAAEGWEWDLERTDVRRMCLDWICKHPELADTLPDKLRADFIAKRGCRPLAALPLQGRPRQRPGLGWLASEGSPRDH